MLLGVAALAYAGVVDSDYITPSFTFSPDNRYGVKLPVYHDEADDEQDSRKNQVVEMATGRVVAVINGDPGYDRALNHHQTAPPRWSQDSSLLLWRVDGKWFPHALVLVKLENDKEKWQLDLMKAAQKEILDRTRQAAPRKYSAAKKANAGNGSAYPEGFTVTVERAEEGTSVSLPLRFVVDLTANPKGIGDFPANLESQLDAVVGDDGKFVVKRFQLGARRQ